MVSERLDYACSIMENAASERAIYEVDEAMSSILARRKQQRQDVGMILRYNMNTISKFISHIKYRDLNRTMMESMGPLIRGPSFLQCFVSGQKE